MQTDSDACYRALAARDARFDGLFYVGVTTTGIYCRPVCPARTPGRTRCLFYRLPAEAEKAGFRACFRCRPELAPGAAPMDAVSRLVRASLARIEAGALNEGDLDALATELGVSARHLRRATERELGVSPVELAQSARLALAKQLVSGSKLPLAEIAFASGFSSVRRFNALFRARFARTPSELRRREVSEPASEHLAIQLGVRAPFAWDVLLSFLGARATPGVERVEDGAYLRSARIGARSGWIRVAHDPSRRALHVEVAPSLAPVLMQVASAVRDLFDLDAEPGAIAAHLARDALLAPLVRRTPGLRVPGAFDAFELAVRAILGQQVSVRAATTLAGRLAAAFGEPLGPSPHHAITHLAPSAERLAAVPARELAAIGLPSARAAALAALAEAFSSRALRLDRGADPQAAALALERLPGVGRWTAQYVVMRALRSPDAFPDSDLGLRRALGGITARALSERAEAWRPWRAYAALHLWGASTGG